jgi:hypothetical protein
MATIRLDDDGVEVLDEDGERLLTLTHALEHRVTVERIDNDYDVGVSRSVDAVFRQDALPAGVGRIALLRRMTVFAR